MAGGALGDQFGVDDLSQRAKQQQSLNQILQRLGAQQNADQSPVPPIQNQPERRDSGSNQNIQSLLRALRQSNQNANQQASGSSSHAQLSMLTSGQQVA